MNREHQTGERERWVDLRQTEGLKEVDLWRQVQQQRMTAAIANAIKASSVVVQVTPRRLHTILSKIEKPLVVYAKGGFFSANYQYLVSYKGSRFSPNPLIPWSPRMNPKDRVKMFFHIVEQKRFRLVLRTMRKKSARGAGTDREVDQGIQRRATT